MRHVLSVFQLSRDDILEILRIARELKSELRAGRRRPLLAGRTLAMLFEKPSLRTRVSFEVAMVQLGGSSLFLGQDVGWGQREPLADFGRVLSSYVDAIVCRANSHARVAELTQFATCPVINGLTNLAHPCQALADVLTLEEEFGELAGLKLAYVGDANNVARSLAVACGRLGLKFAIACPEAYRFDRAFVTRLHESCPGLDFTETSDPHVALRGAHGVYTDVWTSMGQEGEREERRQAFAPYQVNAALWAHAPREARFLHCMPARRDEEVTADVIDGPQSAVLPQAENRLHLQKGLLVWLLTHT